jgi:hypothetical protein
MENKYTLEKLLKDLENGFGLYYTYLDNRYLLRKVADNAYSQELITIKEKSPHPKLSIVSLKVVKEIYKGMTDFEYEV